MRNLGDLRKKIQFAFYLSEMFGIFNFFFGYNCMGYWKSHTTNKDNYIEREILTYRDEN